MSGVVDTDCIRFDVQHILKARYNGQSVAREPLLLVLVRKIMQLFQTAAQCGAADIRRVGRVRAVYNIVDAGILQQVGQLFLQGEPGGIKIIVSITDIFDCLLCSE